MNPWLAGYLVGVGVLAGVLATLTYQHVRTWWRYRRHVEIDPALERLRGLW